MDNTNYNSSLTTPGSFAYARDSRDFRMTPGNEDLSGWEVRDQDQRKIGEVENLIIDTTSQQPAFAEIALKQGWFKADKLIRVPFSQLTLDTQDRAVRLAMDETALGALPERSGDLSTLSWDRNTSGVGTRSLDEDTRLTLHEEQARFNTQATQTGEARVAKQVETQTLEKTVPVMHEELVVERRPLSADQAVSTEARIEGDEIRVPLTAETVSVEKRVVPTEEIVISKRQVQEERTIQTDLQRETLQVDRGVPIDPQ